MKNFTVFLLLTFVSPSLTGCGNLLYLSKLGWHQSTLRLRPRSKHPRHNNNAVLLAYRRYFHRLEKFEMLYEQFGRDTRRVVEYFKTIRATGDRAALQSFLE